MKLFDFGLCKEIPSDPRKRCSGNLYKMTGRTGSRHYMAPEVALSQPYNQSADTFSFGILLWEILSLKPPFETFDGHDYIEKVRFEVILSLPFPLFHLSLRRLID